LISAALDVAEGTDLEPSAADNNFKRLVKATMKNAVNADAGNLAPQAKALDVVSDLLHLKDRPETQTSNTVTAVNIINPSAWSRPVCRQHWLPYNKDANSH
jgi:hypothetical protein